MKKTVLIISTLLLIFILASCASSPEEPENVSDIKVTVTGGTGTSAKYNGTFYVNSKEAAKSHYFSKGHGVYSDEQCTKKVCNIYFSYRPDSVEAKYVCMLVDDNEETIGGEAFSLNSKIIKSASTKEIVFTTGTSSGYISEEMKVSLEIIREVSFALAEMTP